jgi:uncharacterized membrane protein
MVGMTPVRTERGIERLVNFTDAAVAIAITLLVLPLVDVAGELEGESTLGDLLAENWGSILAFVVTFAVIARLWLGHHRVFEMVADYSTPLIWVNMIWLASIVTLPFSANALSFVREGDLGVYALYIGNIIVTVLAMIGIELVLRRTPSLVRPDARRRIDVRPSLAVLVVLVLALVLSIAVPVVGMFWLLLLLLTVPLRRWLERRDAAA